MRNRIRKALENALGTLTIELDGKDGAKPQSVAVTIPTDALPMR